MMLIDSLYWSIKFWNYECYQLIWFRLNHISHDTISVWIPFDLRQRVLMKITVVEVEHIADEWSTNGIICFEISTTHYLTIALTSLSISLTIKNIWRSVFPLCISCQVSCLAVLRFLSSYSQFDLGMNLIWTTLLCAFLSFANLAVVSGLQIGNDSWIASQGFYFSLYLKNEAVEIILCSDTGKSVERNSPDVKTCFSDDKSQVHNCIQVIQAQLNQPYQREFNRSLEFRFVYSYNNVSAISFSCFELLNSHRLNLLLGICFPCCKQTICSPI